MIRNITLMWKKIKRIKCNSPLFVYTTVYGYDEKRKGESVIDESLIKRIVKETLRERYL
jgi:hypothetical protein